MVSSNNIFCVKFRVIVAFGLLIHIYTAVAIQTWKSDVIPYEINTTAGFTDIRIGDLRAAMEHWQYYTCIIFVERNATEHKDLILFTKQLDCG